MSVRPLRQDFRSSTVGARVTLMVHQLALSAALARLTGLRSVVTGAIEANKKLIQYDPDLHGTLAPLAVSNGSIQLQSDRQDLSDQLDYDNLGAVYSLPTRHKLEF